MSISAFAKYFNNGNTMRNRFDHWRVMMEDQTDRPGTTRFCIAENLERTVDALWLNKRAQSYATKPTFPTTSRAISRTYAKRYFS